MHPRLELIPVSSDNRPVLENLIELYIHDFSELVPVDIGEDGRFGYKALSRYWSEPGHHPFLARVEGKLAGFALVTRRADPSGDGEVWDITEFFVLRRYRRRGVGIELAEAIWNLYPGNWSVRVRANNLSGRSFWESAIAKVTGRPTVSQDFVVEGVVWRVFSFRSPPLKVH